MSRRKRRTGRSRYGLMDRGEDVNPMNYISNLADAMLVLAMGIMVALVVHWNVDLGQTGGAAGEEGTDQVVTFDDSQLQERTQLPDSATPAGEVYYDGETDTYYIVDGK